MDIKGTTILGIKRNGVTVIAADGQATLGDICLKGNVKKVRRLYNDKVVLGFAGSVADGFTLYNKFEELLQKYSGNLMRSAVELGISFREEKRQLEANLIVADKDKLYFIMGNGDVVEPEDGVIATGSGGNYAYAASKALLGNTKLSAREIAEKAMQIAADLCIYTNHNFIFEEVK